MNKLKQLCGVALVLAFAASLPLRSHAENANRAPQDGSRGGLHENLKFQGRKTKRIVASASATLLVSGEGFLDAICAFGGTLGKYSMAYDTAAGDFVADDTYTYAITPKVYTTNDSTSAQHGNVGCWEPRDPVKFTAGLYGKASNNGHATLYYVHCANGANPCSL